MEKSPNEFRHEFKTRYRIKTYIQHDSWGQKAVTKLDCFNRSVSRFYLQVAFFVALQKDGIVFFQIDARGKRRRQTRGDQNRQRNNSEPIDHDTMSNQRERSIENTSRHQRDDEEHVREPKDNRDGGSSSGETTRAK